MDWFRGGSTVFNISLTNNSLNTDYKSAVCYKLNDYASYTDGSSNGTDTIAIVPVVTQFGIGKVAYSTNYMNGTIKKLAYYPTRLTNAELQALTED